MTSGLHFHLEPRERRFEGLAGSSFAVAAVMFICQKPPAILSF